MYSLEGAMQAIFPEIAVGFPPMIRKPGFFLFASATISILVGVSFVEARPPHKKALADLERAMGAALEANRVVIRSR